MSEFDPSQLPGRFKAYPIASVLYADYVATAQGRLRAEYGQEADLPKGDSIPFVEERRPLPLPSVGSDEASLWHFGTMTPGQMMSYKGPVLGVNIYLFNDGSPFVAEGDPIEGSYDNGYRVVLSAESPPVIVQDEQVSMGMGDPSQWETCRQVPLTDAECDQLMTFLLGQIVDIEQLAQDLR